jgi:hypothetical protein
MAGEKPEGALIPEMENPGYQNIISQYKKRSFADSGNCG